MRFSHTLKQAAASSQYTSLMPCTLIVFILWAWVRWGKILMTEITIKQFIARAAFTSVMGSFVYLILFITSDSHWGIAEINFRTPFWASIASGSSSGPAFHHIWHICLGFSFTMMILFRLFLQAKFCSITVLYSILTKLTSHFKSALLKCAASDPPAEENAVKLLRSGCL